MDGRNSFRWFEGNYYIKEMPFVIGFGYKLRLSMFKLIINIIFGNPEWKICFSLRIFMSQLMGFSPSRRRHMMTHGRS